MKNRILKFVFSVGLSLTLTMSCISPVFTYAAEVEEVRTCSHRRLSNKCNYCISHFNQKFVQGSSNFLPLFKDNYFIG